MSESGDSPEQRFAALNRGLMSLEALLDRADELTPDERVEAMLLLSELRGSFASVAGDARFRPSGDPLAAEASAWEHRLGAAATRAQHLFSGQAVEPPRPVTDSDASPSTDPSGKTGNGHADSNGGTSNGGGATVTTAVRTIPASVVQLVANVRPTTPEERTRRFSLVLTAVGGVFVLLLLYLLVASTLFEARDQHVLLREFKRTLVAQAGATSTKGGGAEEQGSGVLTGDESKAGEESTTSATPAVPPPHAGDPVAIIAIPRLGLEQVVVEGTGASETMKGPGHLRSSPMPGERGNAVVVGRRSTYGAPFADLDQLRRGDRIIVTTPRRVSRYVVAKRPAEAGTDETKDADPLAPSVDNTLTLVTSTPQFLASNRLVVVADLQGTPVSTPPLTLRGGTVSDDETGLSPSWGAIPGLLIWAQFLLLAFVIARLLYLRWLRWPTYLLTTPVLLALSLLVFDSFAKLLPSSL